VGEAKSGVETPVDLYHGIGDLLREARLDSIPHRWLTGLLRQELQRRGKENSTHDDGTGEGFEHAAILV
jgi:hypothetical protein